MAQKNEQQFSLATVIIISSHHCIIETLLFTSSTHKKIQPILLYLFSHYFLQQTFIIADSSLSFFFMILLNLFHLYLHLSLNYLFFIKFSSCSSHVYFVCLSFSFCTKNRLVFISSGLNLILSTIISPIKLFLSFSSSILISRCSSCRLVLFSNVFLYDFGDRSWNLKLLELFRYFMYQLFV